MFECILIVQYRVKKLCGLKALYLFAEYKYFHLDIDGLSPI